MQVLFHVLILRHVGFNRLVGNLVRDDKQAGKPDSQRPPGKIISALHVANYFRDCSPCFTSFLDMSISFFKIDLP